MLGQNVFGSFRRANISAERFISKKWTSEFTVSYGVAFCPSIDLYDFERWLIVVHGSIDIKNGSVRLSMVRG
jgi:hypothetical protein